MMDDVTEISVDQLPRRKLRGTKINANKDAYREPDPKVIGWRQLKRGNWTCKRSIRNAGLQHVIEKCLANGMNYTELSQVYSDALNTHEVSKDDSNE